MSEITPQFDRYLPVDDRGCVRIIPTSYVSEDWLIEHNCETPFPIMSPDGRPWKLLAKLNLNACSHALPELRQILVRDGYPLQWKPWETYEERWGKQEAAHA